MKDRIRLLMESQHMNQQSFASYIGLSPATLSSILQERTRPTLATVDSVCKKFPNVNLAWLINGTGDMFLPSDGGKASGSGSHDAASPDTPSMGHGDQPTLNFSFDEGAAPQQSPRQVPSQRQQSIGRQPMSQNISDVKIIDKPSRRITEIRVFYDDQTWESFVPKK